MTRWWSLDFTIKQIYSYKEVSKVRKNSLNKKYLTIKSNKHYLNFYDVNQEEVGFKSLLQSISKLYQDCYDFTYHDEFNIFCIKSKPDNNILSSRDVIR